MSLDFGARAERDHDEETAEERERRQRPVYDLQRQQLVRRKVVLEQRATSAQPAIHTRG